MLFAGKGLTLVLDKQEIVTLYQSNISRHKKVLEKNQKEMISKHNNRSLLKHLKHDKQLN